MKKLIIVVLAAIIITTAGCNKKTEANTEIVEIESVEVENELIMVVETIEEVKNLEKGELNINDLIFIVNTNDISEILDRLGDATAISGLDSNIYILYYYLIDGGILEIIIPMHGGNEFYVYIIYDNFVIVLNEPHEREEYNDGDNVLEAEQLKIFVR